MNDSINAATAIVMDADTGTILWGRDVNSKRYPASTTKLLTALIVMENCSPDETVTFTEEAVSNLESGAVSIGCAAGDELTVRECLEALLLKSANEVANALAIHVSGSIDEFAVLMNKRAKELGCMNSDFRNPSGLTDSNHVTTAYDLALIAREIWQQPLFTEIENERSCRISHTSKYEDGVNVTIGHQMMVQGTEYYDARVIGGKTGFTSAAGNTLVTIAEDSGRTVIAVVLKDTNPAHYVDTKALINFGFNNFEKVKPDGEDLFSLLKIEDRLILDKIVKKDEAELSFETDPWLVLPVGADLAEITADYSYDGLDDEETALLTFRYADRVVGTGTVINTYEPTLAIEELEEKETTEKLKESESGFSPVKVVIICLIVIVAFIIIMIVIRVIEAGKQERERRERLRKRRERRLREQREMEQTEDRYF